MEWKLRFPFPIKFMRVERVVDVGRRDAEHEDEDEDEEEEKFLIHFKYAPLSFTFLNPFTAQASNLGPPLSILFRD